MHIKGTGILTLYLRLYSFVSVVQLSLAYFQTWGSLFFKMYASLLLYCCILCITSVHSSLYSSHTLTHEEPQHSG